MLNYNSTIKENKTYADLTIKVVEPIMKINIRGKKKEFFTNADKILNIILPTELNISSSSEKLTSFCLSPDEWMIVSNNIIDSENNIYELEEVLFNNISKTKLGAVTNLTDQFAMINLEGSKVFELLSTGSPFNFINFKDKKGSVTQTILNHIDVIIYHKEINNIHLFVRRSFSHHLWNWINDSASRL
tara:strand:+ start:30 stop:593 length:564 start_codon:yes stop_codon:yes gene_type:complete